MLSKKKPQDRVDPEYLVGLDTASAQPAPTGVRPFIKKHWKPITAAICAAAVAAAVLVPKNSAKPAAASAQYVETRPEKRNIVNSYSADGTITAADTYTVRPMVKGSILTADFEVGDTVSKGDVLYTIDSSDVASSVEKAQLSLKQAQSSYDDAVDTQYIRSSVRGTVSSLKVKAGDTVGSSSSTTETMCVIYDLSYLEMTLDVDELDILDIQVGQKAEITADAISDRTFEGVVTSISSAVTTSGGTTTYPVTIRIDDTGSLMPGMNATAALDIPPCRRYVIVKATAGFAVFRLILKSLLFYSCLDFTQNLGKTHFCLTFGVHFSIRSLFFWYFLQCFCNWNL